MHFLCHAFFYGGFMGQQERSSSGQTVRSVFRSYLLRFVFWIFLILIGFSILPSAAGIWDKLISGSGSRIKNYSRISGASYPIEISVAYGTNLENAKSIIQNVVFHNIRFFGDSKPTVIVKEAGDFGITLKVVVMTKTPEDNPVACSECLQQIISEFTKEGIEIPYPTHVVYQKDILKSEEEHGTGRKHHN